VRQQTLKGFVRRVVVVGEGVRPVAEVRHQLSVSLEGSQSIEGYGASNSQRNNLVALVQELMREQSGAQARVDKAKNLKSKPIGPAETHRQSAGASGADDAGNRVAPLRISHSA
jgi:hypothetical protein